MGAICGIIGLNHTEVSESIGKKMMNIINIYPHDKDKSMYSKEVFMGCSFKFITPESVNEELPFYDEQSKLTIVADAIIDNRNYLYNLLDIRENEQKIISDSQIILKAFKKWGEECVNYLVGDFAFAIWDSKSKELFCARDHVGKRTLYYYHSKEVFAFCTIIKPIFQVLNEDIQLNDAWIADFLCLQGVAHEVGDGSTVYKDIYQLSPAHSLTVKNNRITTKLYWDPLNVEPLKLKSDEEYEEAFREVLAEAVKCRLRSIGSVGVMLSGGLDSGAVACVAATQMLDQANKMKAYSSIPFSNFKNYLSKSAIADESSYIKEIVEYNKNIDLTLLKSENRHSLTKVKDLLDIFEQPYKVIQNIFWLDDITETASKEGCTILLDGQFGNNTISFGDFTTQAITLFQRKRIVALLREIHGYSKVKSIRKLKVAKYVLKNVLPSNLKKIIGDKNSQEQEYEITFPINKLLLDKYKINERFDKIGITRINNGSFNLQDIRKFIVRPMMFEQLAPTETKISLAYGIAKRDPTRDKRVIEFCFSLPGDQYVRSGNERFLIRRAMKDIMPDKVRLNTETRGRQGADWIQRLQPHWKDIKKELGNICDNEKFKSYIDVDKLKECISEVGDIPNEKHRDSIQSIVISYIFAYFLESINSSQLKKI